jgi:hypothetical protein
LRPQRPFTVASIAGDWTVEPAIVDTAKDADVEPPETVTVVGFTVAAEVLLLDTLTDAPPEGAYGERTLHAHSILKCDVLLVYERHPPWTN